MQNGIAKHNSCISHCLQYAFGSCQKAHFNNCTNCENLFIFFEELKKYLPLDKKPKYVTIISDNGGHYHNTELMIILLYWKEWYDICVNKWIFLEAGEAKTIIDSHHAQVRIFSYL